jgi:hypothetical protein
MVDLFTKQYVPLWTLVLAAMLFFPVRHLIWVLYIRRAEKDNPTDDTQRTALKRRAGVTSALLSFLFSYFYTTYLFVGR